MLRRLTLAAAVLLTVPLIAAAQDDATLVQAVIRGPLEVQVGRTIVLDASASKTLTGAVRYAWYQDQFPQSISRSVEALFTPEEPGDFQIRLVVEQDIGGETVRSETTQTITAYTRKIVLITDNTLGAEKLEAHREAARELGVFLPVMQPASSAIPLGSEEALAQLLGDQYDRLSGAEVIVVWTSDPIAGMQALLRATRIEEGRLAALREQSIIVMTEGSLRTVARAIRAPFSVMEPQRLVLTRKESFTPLLESPDLNAFVETLTTRDVGFLTLDQSSLTPMPWTLLTSLVTYMLTHGVASQTVILLLMLPVIATIIAFLKQVIGVTTFGLYTPSILALSFLALGWPIGIVMLLFILLASYAARRILRKWRLLYIPKIAIILTAVSVTLLAALALGASLGIVLTADTIFVLLIMSTLSESFLTLEKAEGRVSALLGIVETVLAALLCVFIVRWPLLQSFILAYPESILLTVICNILLGRYTGLRVVEYFRFRSVFHHLQEE